MRKGEMDKGRKQSGSEGNEGLWRERMEEGASGK